MEQLECSQPNYEWRLINYISLSPRIQVAVRSDKNEFLQSKENLAATTWEGAGADESEL